MQVKIFSSTGLGDSGLSELEQEINRFIETHTKKAMNFTDKPTKFIIQEMQTTGASCNSLVVIIIWSYVYDDDGKDV